MTVVAAGLTLWAVRRLTAPVRTLAAAAEALGRDVNAPPLPEDGPLEVAIAAAAFNTMAARIRRFVQDRTESAHRDRPRPAHADHSPEAARRVHRGRRTTRQSAGGSGGAGGDGLRHPGVRPRCAHRRGGVGAGLAELLRTLLDEAGDARPEAAERLDYEGPPHWTVRVRPLALKRALTNLITNAVIYGGGARVRLVPPASVGAAGAVLTIEIEDDGPGIPPGELERVFEPFHRGEPSRNRETGGVGLGLPIARNILRAHGGDVVLANRPTGGAKATVTLPA